MNRQEAVIRDDSQFRDPIGCVGVDSTGAAALAFAASAGIAALRIVFLMENRENDYFLSRGRLLLVRHHLDNGAHGLATHDARFRYF
jgi:hypothetical protein